MCGGEGARVHALVTHCEMQSRWQEYEKSTAANQDQVRASVCTCMCVCICAPTPPALSRSSSLAPPFSSLPVSAPFPSPPFPAPHLLQPPSLPAPSLSPPPSLPKTRKVPEDRLGQVVQLIIVQIKVPAGNTGEGGITHGRHACVSMAACTWGGDVPPAACVC